VGDEGLCAYGLAGLRQFNQYRMGHPEETTWETGLRIDRMLAESTINSFGGGPERTKRLVPWMTTPLYAAGDQNEENYITKPECRELLAMLRAKRIHEGMWWLDKRPGVDATQDEQWQKIWDATQDCSHRVYATRVSKYQRTFEPFPAPPHPPYNVNRLEYTRKDDEVFNGTPRRAEVDVKGRLVVTTGEEPLYKTELVVDFEYQDLWAIAHDHVESYLEAHVEHRSSALGTRTIVYLYDWEPPAGQSNWKQISPNEYADPATGLGVYLCHTSQIDGHWEDRRTFSTDATASFIAPRWAHMDPVDGKYKSKLKLIQFNSVPFWSYYDLVQLIPAWDYVAGPNQSTAAVYQSQSDVNLDGVSNVADVNLYIDNWISADPAADLDLNESVDTTDLDTFVEAYLTGG
jgi:hypothetical protein